jgi:hypothetical protein
MECPACNGDGCSQCREGEFEIVGCPQTFVTDDIWQMLHYCDLYEKGLPPIGGGALDQTRIFTDAASFVWREQNRWKNEN